MSQIETIVSKVRPIKKLCIIDDDFSKFFEIIQDYSEEIGGFYNLILLHNDSLFSQNTIDFINHHDPDLIINYSNCDNEKLLKKFQIKVIDGKKQGFSYKSIKTPLLIFDNIPENAYSYFKELKKVETYFGGIEGPLHSFLSLNFGIISRKTLESWKENDLLKSIVIQQINPGISNFHGFTALLKREKTLIRFSNAISRISYSTNIWTKSHNKGNFFSEDPTLIIGANDKLDSFIYFWNIRATYPHSVNIWIPQEIFDEDFCDNHLKDFKNYCIFNCEKSEDIRSQIKERNSLCSEIDGSRYYFYQIMNGWQSFEYIQNSTVEDNKIKIIHPQDKLFSKKGFNDNLAIQITGIEESYLPISLGLGRLFVEDNPYESHHFARMSQNGLTILFSEFNPYRETPFVSEILIPDSEEIFNIILKERGIILKETRNTHVVRQVLNLLITIQNVKIFRDPTILNLIVKLTPKRIERLVKNIMKGIEHDISENDVRELLKTNIGDITTISSQIIIQPSQVERELGIKKENKKEYYKKFQQLSDLNILLRGKGVICPSCKQKLWYPLSELKTDLICYCCNNHLTLPIFNENNVEEDSFKINELISNATDQGVLPVLLTIYLLNNQKYACKRFICDYELFEGENKIGEVDIIFNLGRKIGLAEVKADRGFDEKQIERLLEISKKVRANLLVFATEKDETTDEVKNLVSFLNQKNLDIPAFIFTKQVLFGETIPDLSKHFEIRFNDDFPKGPIILKNN